MTMDDTASGSAQKVTITELRTNPPLLGPRPTAPNPGFNCTPGPFRGGAALEVGTAEASFLARAPVVLDAHASCKGSFHGSTSCN